jgi:hypothetical protein
MDDVKNIVKEIKRLKSEYNPQSNVFIQYGEYICESIDKSISYADYLSEKLMNQTFDVYTYSGHSEYSEYLSEKLNDQINFQNKKNPNPKYV